MDKETAIKELRTKIGAILEPMIYAIEEGAIHRFLEAVEDNNPVYRDEEYARKTRYRGVISPPGFYGLPLYQAPDAEKNIDLGIVLEPIMRSLPMLAQLTSRGVNGGTEMEFFRPARPGDLLLTFFRLADIVEKTGKFGSMVIFTFEQIFKNKAGQLVAIIKTTLIAY